MGILVLLQHAMGLDPPLDFVGELQRYHKCDEPQGGVERGRVHAEEGRLASINLVFCLPYTCANLITRNLVYFV